jgi:hypothetical protein
MLHAEGLAVYGGHTSVFAMVGLEGNRRSCVSRTSAESDFCCGDELTAHETFTLTVNIVPAARRDYALAALSGPADYN